MLIFSDRSPKSPQSSELITPRPCLHDGGSIAAQVREGGWAPAAAVHRPLPCRAGRLDRRWAHGHGVLLFCAQFTGATRAAPCAQHLASTCRCNRARPPGRVLRRTRGCVCSCVRSCCALCRGACPPGRLPRVCACATQGADEGTALVAAAGPHNKEVPFAVIGGVTVGEVHDRKLGRRCVAVVHTFPAAARKKAKGVQVDIKHDFGSLKHGAAEATAAAEAFRNVMLNALDGLPLDAVRSVGRPAPHLPSANPAGPNKARALGLGPLSFGASARGEGVPLALMQQAGRRRLRTAVKSGRGRCPCAGRRNACSCSSIRLAGARRRARCGKTSSTSWRCAGRRSRRSPPPTRATPQRCAAVPAASWPVAQ